MTSLGKAHVRISMHTPVSSVALHLRQHLGLKLQAACRAVVAKGLGGSLSLRTADIVHRLEAATSRLEDIASSTGELPQAVPALQQTIASPQSALSTASTPAPPPSATPAPKLPPEPLPESIEEFDAFIGNSVGKYVKLSGKLGGLVAEQAAKALQGFQAQRQFLLITTRAKKPDLTGSEMSVYQDLLKPINESLMAVTNIKESNRGSAVFDNLSAVSEGIMVLAWVTVENRPYKHVEDALGSAQFFGNRVLKQHKDKYVVPRPASPRNRC